jgi:hypothetical protein
MYDKPWWKCNTNRNYEMFKVEINQAYKQFMEP